MKKHLLYAIIACITSAIPINVKAVEAYAALSNDNTILTFYYDNEKSSRNGMDIGPFTGEHGKGRGWYDQRESITTVVFDNSFANYRDLTSTLCWFEGCKNLEKIIGIENLKTENVVYMTSMFMKCKSLTELDVSHFITDNVIDMSLMFYDCKLITSLDVSHFNTKNVLSMAGMFSGLNLNTLDLRNFNTEKVVAMFSMFEDCDNLVYLDLSSFNTSNVTDVRCMFSNCYMLSTIYVGDGWSIEKVEKQDNSMFGKCYNLVGGSGTVWDENHTDYTYAHIDGGPSNPGYLTYKATGGHSDKKCATPTIAFVNGKLTFSCETEGVEYAYEITSADVKKGNASKVTIGGKYNVCVYAMKQGYENSDVATLEFTLGSNGDVCDVNKDGAVNVADIATIISEMAARARLQKALEE